MTNSPTVSRLPASERREQLLETALHVIARQGFHQTSMDDVAKKLELQNLSFTNTLNQSKKCIS